MRSVNLGRWSRRVERFFNIKGGGGLMDIEPSVRMTLPLFGTGVEDRALEGWNRYVFATQQGPVAAQFSALRLRNPVGSNVIAVLERVSIWESVADSVNLSHGFNTTTDLATVSPGVGGIDPRGPQNSTLIPSRTTLVAQTDLGTGSQAGTWASANLPFEYIRYPDEQMPILPGVAFQLCAQVANSTLTVSWMWRERALEASELT